MTLLLRFGEFVFGFLQLLLEGRVVCSVATTAEPTMRAASTSLCQ